MTACMEMLYGPASGLDSRLSMEADHVRFRLRPEFLRADEFQGPTWPYLALFTRALRGRSMQGLTAALKLAVSVSYPQR